LRAIGWLERDQPYEIAPTGKEELACLREQLNNRFVIVDFMGGHTCTLCTSRAPYNSGEMIIPSDSVCYVAPIMIAHYVEVHRYRPPAEFLAALLTCPPQNSAEYMARVSPFLEELRSSRPRGA
jgi:hypothetical protein